MINKQYITDEEIRKILTYIKGLPNHKQIYLMFLCSFNGMRCCNFYHMQIKDVYTPDYKVKDIIYLEPSKNKGHFEARYILNNQIKKEFNHYLSYLKSTRGAITPEMYLFVSRKGKKPYNRVSICRMFKNIYAKFGINASSHFGRHMFITRMISKGINVSVVKNLVNHRSIQTTAQYFNYNESMLFNAVEQAKI